MNFFPNDDEMEKVQGGPEAASPGDDAPVEEQAAADAMTDEGAPEPAEDSGGAAADEEAAAPESGARLILMRSGKETDIVFGFSPPATIGRFDPAVGPIDVDLGSVEEGSYVSRTHARIVLEDDVYKIQDLGSSNGTYILRDDFEKIEEAELHDGDEISLGNARFVFRV
ncbi:MAG: FHA domain-containing protein [Armatimonadetes bacterium]|nr:FHA domain-containing protein [Armatimonadota bacterium]